MADHIEKTPEVKAKTGSEHDNMNALDLLKSGSALTSNTEKHAESKANSSSLELTNPYENKEKSATAGGAGGRFDKGARSGGNAGTEGESNANASSQKPTSGGGRVDEAQDRVPPKAQNQTNDGPKVDLSHDMPEKNVTKNTVTVPSETSLILHH